MLFRSWGTWSSGSSGQVIAGSNSSSGSVSIYTSGIQRFQIDSSGYVTLPNQPCFRAQRTTSFIISAATEIAFNSILFNISSSYNSTTGRFTAPVSGRYYFHASLQAVTSSISNTINFYVNGVSVQYMANGWTISQPARGDISVSGILNLSAGDYVSVYATSSSSGKIGRAHV